MTNRELYNNYIGKKSEVELLTNQLQNINFQLAKAQSEFNDLRQQIEAISNDALLNSLGL